MKHTGSTSHIPVIRSKPLITVQHLANLAEQKKVHKVATSGKPDPKMRGLLQDLQKAKEMIEIKNSEKDAMLNSIGDGVVVVDRELRFILINKKAEEIMGVKAKDLIGKRTTASINLEYLDGEPVPKRQRPTFLAVTQSKASVNMEYNIVREDNTRIPICLTITPVVNSSGETIGAIDVFRDISQQKEIEQAKSEFVSLASHQLRTPLGISKWYLEAILADKAFSGISDAIKDHIQEVYKNNERLLQVVRDLLSVSRIDAGKLKDEPQLTDISTVIETLLQQIHIIAKENKVTLHYTPTPNLPQIMVDPIRFSEVLENLIVNAIKYNKPGGSVEITTVKKGDQLVIKIADTGIGISATDQPKLFTRFFRAANAINSNPAGTGLGLYVAKSYVESRGGTISLKSREGDGSTFTIVLPAHRDLKFTHKGGTA